MLGKFLGYCFISALLCAGGLDRAFATNAKSIPAELLQDEKRFWVAFMAEYYGQYDGSRKCWLTEADGNSYCMKPLRLDLQTDGSSEKAYVVAAGVGLDKAGKPSEYRAATGFVGLFVFQQNGSQFELLAASSRFEGEGTYGLPSSEDAVTLRKLGPSSWAWFVDGSFASQGEFTGVSRIYTAVGDKVIALSDIRTSSSNTGTSCETKCYQIETDIIIDDANKNLRFYPLIARVTGYIGAEKVKETFRLNFDESTFSYEQPVEFARVYDIPTGDAETKPAANAAQVGVSSATNSASNSAGSGLTGGAIADISETTRSYDALRELSGAGKAEARMSSDGSSKSTIPKPAPKPDEVLMLAAINGRIEPNTTVPTVEFDGGGENSKVDLEPAVKSIEGSSASDTISWSPQQLVIGAGGATSRDDASTSIHQTIETESANRNLLPTIRYLNRDDLERPTIDESKASVLVEPSVMPGKSDIEADKPTSEWTVDLPRIAEQSKSVTPDNSSTMPNDKVASNVGAAKASGQQTVEAICMSALNGAKDDWSPAEALKHSVEDAKKRSLTVTDCRRLLGIEPKPTDDPMARCKSMYGSTVFKAEKLENGSLNCSYRTGPKNRSEAIAACKKEFGQSVYDAKLQKDGAYRCYYRKKQKTQSKSPTVKSIVPQTKVHPADLCRKKFGNVLQYRVMKDGRIRCTYQQ